MQTVHGTSSEPQSNSERSRTAVLASYEKDDNLLKLGKLLKNHGWEMLGSAGTSKYLNDSGIACRDVAEIVGKPILGHRVVTLSREIHAGLLARDEDEAELTRLGIRRIDLVYVDLYPLEEEIAKPDATEESVLEKTDIGGPALLRSAAKGRRIVLSRPSQFQDALRYIESGKDDHTYLALLAAEAESVVARYCETSAQFSLKIARGQFDT